MNSMISVSLPFVVGYAVLVSTIVMWLNHRSTRPARTAAVLLAICLVIAFVQLLSRGLAMSTRQAIQMWLLFVLLPTAAVWGYRAQTFWLRARSCSCLSVQSRLSWL